MLQQHFPEESGRDREGGIGKDSTDDMAMERAQLGRIVPFEAAGLCTSRAVRPKSDVQRGTNE